MRITNIPRIIFDKFSEERGHPADKIVYGKTVRELNNDFGAIGFKSIKVRNGYQQTFFLWKRAPQENKKKLEPSPILEIFAGPQSLGIWACGMGKKMKEQCKVRIAYLSGVDLKHPIAKIIPDILTFALALVQESDSEEFWEVEKNPDLPYTRS